MCGLLPGAGGVHVQQKQQELEAELRRRSEEAEALKSAQKRQKRDNEQLHDYLVRCVGVSGGRLGRFVRCKSS